MSRIVAVVGATGVQGGCVVDTLVATGKYKVRGLTRDASSDKAKTLIAKGVEVVQADLGDKAAVIKAFEGAEAVFALTNYYDPAILADTNFEIVQGKNAADAAKEAGVKYFLWSITNESKGKYRDVKHFDNKFAVDEHIKAIGLPASFLHLGFFVDNFVNFGWLKIAENGTDLEMAIPVVNPKTPLTQTWVKKELGATVVALLGNYQSHPEYIHKTFYPCGFKASAEEMVAAIEKKTNGIKINIVTPPTFGLKDVDDMFKFYDEFGLYPDQTFPSKELTDLGVEFYPFDTYVEDTIIPHFKLTKAQS